MTFATKCFFTLLLSVVLSISGLSLRAQPQDTLMARRLMDEAKQHFAQKKIQALIESGEKAIGIYEGLLGTEDIKTAHAYKLVGIGYSHTPQMDKSIELLKKSLKIFTSQPHFENNQGEIADLYTNLAFSEWFSGRYDNLEAYYLEAANIYKTLLGENSLKVADQYYNLGIYKKTVGLNDHALEYYTRAADLYQRSTDPYHPRLAAIYNNIGNIYSNQNDWDNQLLYYLKSLEITLKNHGEDHYETGINYNNIGTVWRKKGNHQKALHYFKKVVAMSNEGSLKQISSKAGALDNIGHTFKVLKQYDSALYYHQRAYQWFQKLYDDNHPELARSLRYLGNVHLEMKQYALAKSAFDKASKIYFQQFGLQNQVLFNLYSDYTQYFMVTNQFDSAFLYNDRIHGFALSHTDKEDIDYDAIRGPVLFLNALNQKGKLHQALYQNNRQPGELDHALKAYNAAIDYTDYLRAGFHEDDSRLILSQQSYKTYENSIGLLIKLFDLHADQKYLGRIFELIEKSKNVNLLASLNRTKIRSYAGVPTELLEKEQRLQAEISLNENLLLKEGSKKDKGDEDKIDDYRRKVFQSKQDYYQLLEHYKLSYPGYFNIKFNTQHLSAVQIQRILNQDEVLLNYFFGQDHIYLAGITNDKLFVKTIDNDSVNDKIEGLRNTIMKRDDEAFARQSHQLYQKLLAPAMDAGISGKNSLIIIPDGKLGQLPFDILVNEAPEVSNYENLNYVLKDHKVRYLHAATFLSGRLQGDGAIKSDELLAFAPVFDKNSSITVTRDGNYLGQIPFAQEEVENIKKVIKATTFSGQNATEGRFKALVSSESYNILHFATHAVVDNESPNFTRLLFANEKDSVNDGKLHAYELYNMKIDANLVTLSACNTGIGAFYKGEGTMSLARAFAYAGCPSVVMSLWPAQDKSTADLMQKFYKNIQAGEQKDEALRNAKLEYLLNADKFSSNPYYWAGFVVLGNNQPIVHSFNLWGLVVTLLVFLSLAFLVTKLGVSKRVKE